MYEKLQKNGLNCRKMLLEQHFFNKNVMRQRRMKDTASLKLKEQLIDKHFA